MTSLRKPSKRGEATGKRNGCDNAGPIRCQTGSPNRNSDQNTPEAPDTGIKVEEVCVGHNVASTEFNDAVDGRRFRQGVNEVAEQVTDGNRLGAYADDIRA